MTHGFGEVGLICVLLGAAGTALANGDPVPTAAPPAQTHFERFVRLSCSPCVQESYPVKAAAVPAV